MHKTAAYLGIMTGADFESLRRRLAWAGWQLTRIESGEVSPAFLVARWNMSRELADLAAVERFADLVGAPA